MEYYDANLFDSAFTKYKVFSLYIFFFFFHIFLSRKKIKISRNFGWRFIVTMTSFENIQVTSTRRRRLDSVTFYNIDRGKHKTP